MQRILNIALIVFVYACANDYDYDEHSGPRYRSLSALQREAQFAAFGRVLSVERKRDPVIAVVGDAKGSGPPYQRVRLQVAQLLWEDGAPDAGFATELQFKLFDQEMLREGEDVIVFLREIGPTDAMVVGHGTGVFVVRSGSVRPFADDGVELSPGTDVTKLAAQLNASGADGGT